MAVAKNGAKQTISSFTELFDELDECQWYWGGISAGTASRLLQRRSPGTFLVRDSRSDRSIFSFSYATASGVYHSRIYRFNGYFCLGGPNALIRSPSLRDFVLQTVARSSVDSGETNCKKTGLSATTASRNAELPLRILMHPSSAEPTAQPVDIRVPLCRNNFVPTLRGACRLAIRRSISDCSRIEELPIPQKLKNTIFALSSGPPPSAIAVLRISGGHSEMALRLLTRSKRSFDDRRMFYTPIFGEDGLLLDKAMACFMKGPRTFTGEDSAELYLHGSRAVIQSVCETLAKMPDLDSAKAGEFTRRAFSNGKMDAAQVEALSDLLGAETRAQLRLSHAQAKVGAYLGPIRQKLVELMAKMEARVDFAEDIGDNGQPLAEQFSAEMLEIGEELRRFVRCARRGQLIRSGLKVALVGRPNVGKSSLMNRLAERELAIVSNVSGTTRDCLEARIQLNGQLVNVVDTAGIREGTEDQLEKEGIRRTLQRASEADLVLLVIDPCQSFGDSENHQLPIASLLSEFGFDPSTQRLIVVVNKLDLVRDRSDRFRIEKILNSDGSLTLAWTSCVNGNGLDELLGTMGRACSEEECGTGEGGEVFLSRERHVHCLERAVTHLEESQSALALWNDPAMAALSLRLCLSAVGEIAGRVVHEQVLDSIFSQFCIGK
ncbi:hypothetical protein niasHS_002602 [Heterodera schachtii]|uniref:tRNA modification GTPase n=1 Tax=Heterodera schachtii TaxID=97005 RepID=A0ABD2KKG7_HETSC